MLRRRVWGLRAVGVATFACGMVPVAAYPAASEAAAAKAHAGCGGRTALGKLACELGAHLPEFGVASVSAKVAPSSGLEKVGVNLSALLTTELRGRRPKLRKPSVVWPSSGKPAAREARVELEVELKQGVLNARARLDTGLPPTFWERIQGKQRGVRVALASARADASVRTLLAPPPRTFQLMHSFSFPAEPPVALACADVNGSVRVVMVGRTNIILGNLHAAKFAADKSLAWKELSEVSPVPLREPIASVTLRSDGSFDVGSTDRRVMVRVSAEGKVLSRTPNLLPWPGMGSVARSGVGLVATSAPTLPGVFDSVAGAELVTAEGALKTVGVARQLGGDSAWIFGVNARPLTVPAVGGSLALGDLDGDGTPEFLASLPTLESEKDALEIRWLDDLTQPKVRFPIADGIVAIAVCPFMGGAHNPILVASRSKLWVFE